MSQFTPEYFIAKFEAIPDELWHVGAYDGPANSHCALGHCGTVASEEGFALMELLDHVVGAAYTNGQVPSGPAVVNDGKSDRYKQATPKERILAALRDLLP
jgi:hypothetical protein